MINIKNICNSTIQHTKSAASLCAKAIGAAAGGIALSNLVRISGLDPLISAVARPLSYVGLPLYAVDHIFQLAAQKITPPIYYESDLQISDCQIGISRGNWSYSCPLISSGIIAGIGEEFLCRGVLQQKILPWIAKKLPTSVGDILNKKITRIFLTSLIFAAGHGDKGLSDSFVKGMIYGTIAEITQSLKIPIFSHIINNASIMFLAANANRFGARANSSNY